MTMPIPPTFACDGTSPPHDAYYSKLGHTHAGGGGMEQHGNEYHTPDFAGLSHSHAESEVTNLVTDLAGKAAASHSHPESEVTNLVTDLAGKSPTSHNHALNNLSEKSYNSLTDKPAAVGIGYTLYVQALTSSPADSVTVYFGQLPKAPVSAAATSKVYIRKAGTIKAANIYVYSGTAGSNESWSLYVRLNNTTDYLIQTVSVSASERVFSNVALSIAVSVGDYIEIKGVQPLWATNPLTTIYGGYLYIE